MEGDASKEIAKYIRDTAIIGGKGFYNDLVNLLKEIKKEAREGDTILFSPGATSFNLFQNEFDRGRKFNEAVQKIFNAS
ncbi:MAG: UDP-N-acetylmuramoylalanine-D-glutamate ligase [uncultured bacterium]|nr:MAG: UDP-N-acetylmuramoylalanine-D-glutamate ligase [uncultured bacterium]